MDYTKQSEAKPMKSLPPTARISAILEQLTAIACSSAEVQFDAFATRLSDALLELSKTSFPPKAANLSYNAGNLLKNNGYAFSFLALCKLKQYLKQEIDAIVNPKHKEILSESDLTLIPYEEMEKQLLLSSINRSIEIQHSDRLAALSTRIAHLVDSSGLPAAKNPFRPIIFINAINDAWCEFNPDITSHHLALPLLKPNVFLDLAQIIQSLNQALIQRGIMPDITDSYRIKKSTSYQNESVAQDAELSQKLRQMFSSAGKTHGDVPKSSGHLASDLNAQTHDLQMHLSNPLFGLLTKFQKNIFEQPTINIPSEHSLSTSVLVNLKNLVPQGSLTTSEEITINLLTKIFDTVFRDQHIPTDIKSLIGLLQVPVLKSALVDNNFFFEEEHPARRLIELLSKSSIGRDQNSEKNDPFYQTIKNNIKRVQDDFNQRLTVFSEAIESIEAFINEEENASTEALAAPISQAIQQEKIIKANTDAKAEVALRIGTGEVVAFVETFLENKWVTVLTLAYSIKDEKPQLIASAIKTMDDLIWSVKPKITLEERKELVAKLPTMLGMLNKWLNIAKLGDAERLQFFAELAECHASIVRAPLELSPQKQLEISIDVAKQAAERRMQKSENNPLEAEPDEFIERVQSLKRGAWIEFAQPDGTVKKFKLSWISPLRSLYIFSSSDKRESFSLQAEQLAQSCREKRARIVLVVELVGRALAEALESTGANDPIIASQTAA